MSKSGPMTAPMGVKNEMSGMGSGLSNRRSEGSRFSRTDIQVSAVVLTYGGSQLSSRFT